MASFCRHFKKRSKIYFDLCSCLFFIHNEIQFVTLIFKIKVLHNLYRTIECKEAHWENLKMHLQ